MSNFKEVKFKKAIEVGVNSEGQPHKLSSIRLREPTAGDLRGLSLKALIADSKSDDWVILLSRICEPNLSSGAINLLSMKNFTLLIGGVLELLGEDEEDIQIK